MGGRLHSEYIGVDEAKNVGVVSFPSSVEIAKIDERLSYESVKFHRQTICGMPVIDRWQKEYRRVGIKKEIQAGNMFHILITFNSVARRVRPVAGRLF